MVPKSRSWLNCKCQERRCKVLPNPDPIPRFPLVLIIQPQKPVHAGKVTHFILQVQRQGTQLALMLAPGQHRREEGRGHLQPPTCHRSKQNRASALKPGAGGQSGQSRATTITVSSKGPEPSGNFIIMKGMHWSSLFPSLQNGLGAPCGTTSWSSPEVSQETACAWRFNWEMPGPGLEV